MIKQDWQITEPFTAIIFDCDGTLTSIEGIDYLAELHGVYHPVARLTQEAMAKSGLTPALYQQRLDLVQPNEADMMQLGMAYCDHLMPDVAQVMRALQAFNKTIYIISAGLQPAVNHLADYLTIPLTQVKAVGVSFDDKKAYRSFDSESPLIHNHGKQTFVKEIQKTYSRILYVGDGLNDLAVKSHVTRFVGFGGAFYRNHIAEESDFYITDFSALLPLALTEAESKQLVPELAALYWKGLDKLKG